MSLKHTFKLSLNWKSNSDGQLNTNFNRDHEVFIEGKDKSLEMSSAKTFKGNASKYNPEDLLLTSLASCHMMSYLYLCAQNKIEVLQYEDTAEGILEIDNTGVGRFTLVTLYPKVTLLKEEQKNKAEELHKQANAICFIANSCNFPVKHEVTIIIK